MLESSLRKQKSKPRNSKKVSIGARTPNANVASQEMDSEKTMLKSEKMSNDVSRVSTIMDRSSDVQRSVRFEL
jgi:hypothetical protein